MCYWLHMVEQRTFQAFFSYAHHDEKTDRSVVEALTSELELRVNAKLVNARFRIWRDTDGLRLGANWDAKLEAEIRSSGMMIVLMTPRWIESDYCRREFLTFEETEASRPYGEFVAPLLARQMDDQKRYFTPDQQTVYHKLSGRQYYKVIATDFVKLTKPKRIEIVDNIADDIVGMIERLRQLPPTGEKPLRARSNSAARELDRRAMNFEEVGVVSSEDVVLGPTQEGKGRVVSAQISFHERLFVEGEQGRVEFSVRRAYLTISAKSGDRISQLDEFKDYAKSHGARYVIFDSRSNAVSVCMDPIPGQSGLAELALPPSKGQNRLADIAAVEGGATPNQLTAELLIALSPDGLFLPDERKDRLTPAMRKKIAAIINVAACRDPFTFKSKRLHRVIEVRERAR